MPGRRLVSRTNASTCAAILYAAGCCFGIGQWKTGFGIARRLWMA
jgi:hypothetical protein